MMNPLIKKSVELALEEHLGAEEEIAMRHDEELGELQNALVTKVAALEGLDLEAMSDEDRDAYVDRVDAMLTAVRTREDE